MKKEEFELGENAIIYQDLPRPDDGIRKAFQEFGTADIAGVSAKKSLLDANIRPIWEGAYAFGPALTVINARNDTLMLHYAVELCKAGDILIVTAEEGSSSALWGKMLTIVAQARGVAGAIIDGSVRDSVYIRSKKFPVWSRSISPLGSQRIGAGRINTPLWIGDVLINPGDLVLADDDGIVAFSTGEAERILKGAKEGLQKEITAMPQLEKGISPFRIWGMDTALRESGIKIFPAYFSEEKEQNDTGRSARIILD
jgi:4-hydroxy-4-methyl-2-oxoglutarate aldolase